MTWIFLSSRLSWQNGSGEVYKDEITRRNFCPACFRLKTKLLDVQKITKCDELHEIRGVTSYLHDLWFNLTTKGISASYHVFKNHEINHVPLSIATNIDKHKTAG